ncbi:hypothetical protein M407DRAFT_140565 [Tulasnella calospora MUT 4182]|uniref:Uncharacterized protein n=1 Tax=Tulasnella calospora MUT 4182 TaxID=1051891 RepID=A0A0C3LF74_9AGAM|nr:hypothetical protein M407DRAFT_140565 [Tulasnella calospora MUT 4182]
MATFDLHPSSRRCRSPRKLVLNLFSSHPASLADDARSSRRPSSSRSRVAPVSRVYFTDRGLFDCRRFPRRRVVMDQDVAA